MHSYDLSKVRSLEIIKITYDDSAAAGQLFAFVHADTNEESETTDPNDECSEQVRYSSCSAS